MRLASRARCRKRDWQPSAVCLPPRSRSSKTVSACPEWIRSTRFCGAPTTRTTALEAAAEIRRHVTAGDERQAFRTWLAFNDDLGAETATNRVVLTAYPPAPTGNALYDAALAALAEFRLRDVGAPVPDWVSASPALTSPTVFTDSRYVSAAELGTVPDEFARRGVLIDLESLGSV